MRRCESCSEPIPDQAKFCPSCGEECTPLAETIAAEPTARPDEPYTDSSAQDCPDDQPRVPAHGAKRKRRRIRRARFFPLLGIVLLLIVGIVLLLRGCGKRAALQATPALPADAQATPVYTSQFASTDASATQLEVPDVVGMAFDAACARLEQAGLVVDASAAGYDSASAVNAVLTQSRAAGETALSGDHIALTYNALPLTLNAFAFSPREGRITLGNLIAVCDLLDTTNPTFTFSVVIHATEDYELKGGFRCLTGASEKTPITRVNTQLLREGKAIQGLVAENAYDDSIGWTISLDDWTGFHFDHVTGYDVTIASRADASLSLSSSYSPVQTKSMTLLDCGFSGGRVRLDVAGQKQLVIRLTDDNLHTGYTNSASPGTRAPVWTVKLPIDSYRWIEATVDGSGGEPTAQMRATGRMFVDDKGGADDKKPVAFDGVSCSVDGDTLVIFVTIPDELDYSVYEIAWLELTSDNGAMTFKSRIR